MRAFNKGGCNKNCPKKKKGKEYPKHTSKKKEQKKKEKIIKKRLSRETRETKLCDVRRLSTGPRRRRRRREQPLLFLSFFRGGESIQTTTLLSRARRKRRQNREEEECIVVVVVFESRKKEEKCFKLLGTTRRSNSDAFFEVLWLALHRRVWFGSSGTETNSKRDASSGIVDRDRA